MTNLIYNTLKHCAQTGERIPLTIIMTIMQAGRALSLHEICTTLGVRRTTTELQVRRLVRDGYLYTRKRCYRKGKLRPIYAPTQEGQALYSKAITHIAKLTEQSTQTEQ